MKVEEIKLALEKNREAHIKLNIVSILAGDLSKGDAKVVSARGNIKAMIQDLNDAKQIYNDVIPTADKYIDMAKALGESGIQKSLEKTKKDALDAIKNADRQIKILSSL